MPAWFLIAWQVAQAVYYVFKYGPQLVTMVQEIVAMLKRLRANDDEKKTMALELKAGVAHYRATGDKAPLRRLREKLHKRCYGGE